MAKLVLWPNFVNTADIEFVVITAMEFPSDFVFASVILFVKGTPTVPVNLLAEVK